MKQPILKLGLLAVVAVSLCTHANANASQSRLQIFNVQKSLPLTNDEPVVTDYYINAGKSQGITPNMIIPVVRRVSVHDPFFNQSAGDIYVDVGTLRVIFVDQHLSVARLHKLNQDEAPVIDFEALMVGDRVDLTRARIPAGNSAGSGTSAPASAAPAAAPAPSVRKDQPVVEKKSAPIPALKVEKTVSIAVPPMNTAISDRPVPIMGEVPSEVPSQRIE